MKRFLAIWMIFLIACEEVVEVDLPASQSLVVIEGWVTDSLSNQVIRITRTNSFSSKTTVENIKNAVITTESSIGDTYSYSYSSNGYYRSNTPYKGINGIRYRLKVRIDTSEIESYWDEMQQKVNITKIEIASFIENDPDDLSQQITVYYPKVTTADPRFEKNFYRWFFYKNDEIYKEPDPIVIQNDRLFNGNLIPNDFRSFGYSKGDKITVELQAISASAFSYLSLLKSQITTLGTSTGTTPAIVSGNLFYKNGEETVLGYFGTTASSIDSISVQE